MLVVYAHTLDICTSCVIGQNGCQLRDYRHRKDVKVKKQFKKKAVGEAYDCRNSGVWTTIYIFRTCSRIAWRTDTLALPKPDWRRYHNVNPPCARQTYYM